MKRKFSKSWKASRQIRKQRKYLANAPLHLKRKMISSHLSKGLRKKYGKRNIPICKGDEVKVMVGKFRGKTGKISIVNIKKQKVAIEGIQRKKKDGAKLNVFFNASNLLVQSLNLDDKKRIKEIARKEPKKIEKIKTEKKENKESKEKKIKEKK